MIQSNTVANSSWRHPKHGNTNTTQTCQRRMWTNQHAENWPTPNKWLRQFVTAQSRTSYTFSQKDNQQCQLQMCNWHGLPVQHASQETWKPPASTLAHRLAVIHPTSGCVGPKGLSNQVNAATRCRSGAPSMRPTPGQRCANRPAMGRADLVPHWICSWVGQRGSAKPVSQSTTREAQGVCGADSNDIISCCTRFSTYQQKYHVVETLSSSNRLPICRDSWGTTRYP